MFLNGVSCLRLPFFLVWVGWLVGWVEGVLRLGLDLDNGGGFLNFVCVVVFFGEGKWVWGKKRKREKAIDSYLGVLGVYGYKCCGVFLVGKKYSCFPLFSHLFFRGFPFPFLFSLFSFSFSFVTFSLFDISAGGPGGEWERGREMEMEIERMILILR